MKDKSTLTFEERCLAETFEDLLLEMRLVGETAPDGMVLDEMEGLALLKGRDLLRRTLESQLQAAAERAEKKGTRSARRGRGTKGRDSESC